MNLIILTAGRSSRQPRAPHGCKALTPVHGRPIIEHQLEAVGAEPIIVCRSDHVQYLMGYGRTMVDDSLAGPGPALIEGLSQAAPNQPTLILYADSYFTDLPEGDHWVGVARAPGGRKWDVVTESGHVDYVFVPQGQEATVCVGLYRFHDTLWLRDRLHWLAGFYQGRFRRTEWGMSPVLNALAPLVTAEVPSWRDIGDEASLARMEAA